MSDRKHYSEYDEQATARCERVLLTLLGDFGPWRERIFLAGGLAPRYLTGQLPEGAREHVGTLDVDLVIGVALGDDAPETYRTLQNNLDKANFKQGEPSFRWLREVDGVTVLVEFLCETDRVEPGAIFKPKGESAGSRFSAFNVRGANLLKDDFVEVRIEGERLDGGGKSSVMARVANVLPYTVLKISSFQDRHDNKDAYDLVFTLLNREGDPWKTGTAAAMSPIAARGEVLKAMELLGERFADEGQDGSCAYSAFLKETDDPEEEARLKREAVATVRAFIRGFRGEKR